MNNLPVYWFIFVAFVSPLLISLYVTDRIYIKLVQGKISPFRVMSDRPKTNRLILIFWLFSLFLMFGGYFLISELTKGVK